MWLWTTPRREKRSGSRRRGRPKTLWIVRCLVRPEDPGPLGSLFEHPERHHHHRRDSGRARRGSSNGGLKVRGGTGKLDLKTSNGTIEIEAAAATCAETSNGNVRFSGSLQKGSHSLETSNGSVELKLLPSTQFQFEASTTNGTVTNRFPGLQTRSGKTGSNRLAGLVGSGTAADVDLKLETSNGSITIEPVQSAEAPRP